MKKNTVTGIVVIVLIIVAAVLYFNRKNTTIDTELSNFAFEDTAAVTKIFMADKNNNTVTLERKNGYWMVNGKYEARKDAMDLLLETVCRVSVKAPVPKASHNTVVKNLAAGAVKVEIFVQDELEKNYYVGYPTQDQTGTYMLLEGSSVPFIMYINGFPGYLSPRFFIDELLWKAPVIFRYGYEQIRSITVEHFLPGFKSFRLYSYGDGKFGLMRLDDSTMIQSFDTTDARFYIAHFKRICWDMIVSEISQERRDSILHSRPAHTITVEDINGNIVSLKAWKKLVPGSHTDTVTGVEVPEFDVDLMYGTMNDIDILLIQYFVFDPVLKDLDYFINRETEAPQL
ncbi:MAG: hypothetical protein KJ607_14290 [Bacteroidetes bacterium]|nr:hypothetical protein [Bacteroidota bacterium]